MNVRMMSRTLVESSSPRLSKEMKPKNANQMDTVLIHAQPSVAGSSSEHRPTRAKEESPLTQLSSRIRGDVSIFGSQERHILHMNAEPIPKTVANAQSLNIDLHPDLAVNIGQ